MNKYALEIMNLNYSYDKSVEVLNGVTFNVKAGTYVSVIGHNAVSYTHLDVYKRQLVNRG